MKSSTSRHLFSPHFSSFTGGGYLVGAGAWTTSANDYSTLSSLPFSLSEDHIPTTFNHTSLDGVYHTDLQQNLSALQASNRVDDTWAYWANSSPLSAPVKPAASPAQWSRLSAPVAAFRTGNGWGYTAQVNQDFLLPANRSGYSDGINLYRFIGNDVINDVFLPRYWSHHQYNRTSTNGPFTLSAGGAVARIGLTALRDFKSTLPWFTTNVGGLPTMSKDRVLDAMYRAGLLDSYLAYYPSAATTLTTMPDAAKGAGWENGWLAHQWYEPSGDPIYVKYRDGDLISRNGHNTVFTVSRNKISGVEAVIK